MMTIKTLKRSALALAVGCGLSAEAQATTPALPLFQLSTLPESATRPDSADNRVHYRVTDRVSYRYLWDNTEGGVVPAPGAMADPGAALWEPSFFVDYSFTDSDDERIFGADGDTHSASIGIDVFTPREYLIGIIYTYSNTDLGAPTYTTESDSNNITAYVSRAFNEWLSLGLTGGYGNADIDTSAPIGAPAVSVDSDSWNVSPFLSATLVKGPVYYVSTLSYMLTDVEGLTTHAMSLEGGVGYSLTDNLVISGLARWHQGLDNEGPTLDDKNWITLGARASYFFVSGASCYVGYEGDVANDSYDNHSVLAGFSLPF